MMATELRHPQPEWLIREIFPVGAQGAGRNSRRGGLPFGSQSKYEPPRRQAGDGAVQGGAAGWRRFDQAAGTPAGAATTPVRLWTERTSWLRFRRAAIASVAAEAAESVVRYGTLYVMAARRIA